jgi:8-oxo-dGTP pyrophosphatase MutT (NUDIX family)
MDLTEDMLEEIMLDTALLENASTPDQIERLRRSYLESLDIVDKEGVRLGAAPRGLAHRLGLRHIVVYCLVTDPGGRWLLQVRDGGRLDISVGGHVQAGEDDYPRALSREFREELGFNLDKVRLQFHMVYNRDAPLSVSKPLVRNRERRLVYHYQLTTSEVDALRAAFAGRESAEEVTNFDWFQPLEVVAQVESGRAADGLAASLKYLMGLA